MATINRIEQGIRQIELVNNQNEKSAIFESFEEIERVRGYDYAVGIGKDCLRKEQGIIQARNFVGFHKNAVNNVYSVTPLGTNGELWKGSVFEPRTISFEFDVNYGSIYNLLNEILSYENSTLTVKVTAGAKVYTNTFYVDSNTDIELGVISLTTDTSKIDWDFLNIEDDTLPPVIFADSQVVKYKINDNIDKQYLIDNDGLLVLDNVNGDITNSSKVTFLGTVDTSEITDNGQFAQIVAADSANNESKKTFTFYYDGYIDNVAPTIEIDNTTISYEFGDNVNKQYLINNENLFVFDNVDGDITNTNQTVFIGDIDTSIVGEDQQQGAIRATDSSGNVSETPLVFFGKDVKSPNINIDAVYTIVNDEIDKQWLIDNAGLVVIDDVDGDITDTEKVTIVPTLTITDDFASQEIEIDAIDSSNNKSKKRIVTNLDSPPVITLKDYDGYPVSTIKFPFAGAITLDYINFAYDLSATDDLDGDLSDDIILTEDSDSQTVTFSVSDTRGQLTEETYLYVIDDIHYPDLTSNIDLFETLTGNLVCGANFNYATFDEEDNTFSNLDSTNLIDDHNLEFYNALGQKVTVDQILVIPTEANTRSFANSNGVFDGDDNAQKKYENVTVYARKGILIWRVVFDYVFENAHGRWVSEYFEPASDVLVIDVGSTDIYFAYEILNADPTMTLTSFTVGEFDRLLDDLRFIDPETLEPVEKINPTLYKNNPQFFTLVLRWRHYGDLGTTWDNYSRFEEDTGYTICWRKNIYIEFT